MAWFTAKDDAPVNEFTAGTVMIDVGEEVVYGEDMDNVNPGDCFLKEIEVENMGTKEMELRLDGVEFDIVMDWDWIGDHFDELCFTGDYDNLEALEEAYNDGDFEIPAFLAPCPGSGWVMEYVKENDEITGFNFYYADGPIGPGETVTLSVVVVFDGEMMGNIWQAAEFNQINGVFEAVQASNEAPSEVWGADWDPAWLAMDCEGALIEGTSGAYAAYFYTGGSFNFEDCCSQNNDNNNEDPQ